MQHVDKPKGAENLQVDLTAWVTQRTELVYSYYTRMRLLRKHMRIVPTTHSKAIVSRSYRVAVFVGSV